MGGSFFAGVPEVVDRRVILAPLLIKADEVLIDPRVEGAPVLGWMLVVAPRADGVEHHRTPGHEVGGELHAPKAELSRAVEVGIRRGAPVGGAASEVVE